MAHVHPNAGQGGSDWLDVSTPEQRRVSLARLIAESDHPHEDRTHALECLVTRIQRSLLVDVLISGAFDGDQAYRHVAGQMADGFLVDSEVNIRMIQLFGDAADLLALVRDGGALPEDIALALKEQA